MATTVRGTALRYPSKQRFGNKNILGKHWKLNLTNEERQERYSRIQGHRCPQPALGKTWNLSEESKQNHREAMQRRVAAGWRPSAKSGIGRGGHRPDLSHFVRSTWEANVARILILHNVVYKYEPCSFQTTLGGYRPDFLLIELNIFLEVKGYDTPEHQAKRALAGIPLILVGSEAYHLLENRFKNRIPEWE